MIIFGLTGGIASGKSTVSKTFRKHNIPLVDADIIARQVVDVGTEGYFKLMNAFGSEFFLEDGSLNRVKLGELVFTEKLAMRMLNYIMGPLIKFEASNQINRWLAYQSSKGEPQIVGYDAALICEMGNCKNYKPLIVVRCHRDTQVERLMKRNSLTREQAVSRIDAQMSTEEKVKMADFVIDTDGTIEESILQTEFIIKKIKNEA